MSAEGLRIITNNVPRLIIEGYELTPAERAEFDYLDWTEDGGDDDTPAPIHDGFQASFVRYRGQLYDLGEAMASTDPEISATWAGYWGETFFSSVLVRYVDGDSDRVVIGLALA